MTEKMSSWTVILNTNKQNKYLSILRPFQDQFSSYETGISVGGAKTGEHRKKHLAHKAELGLSHMLASAVLEHTPDIAVR